MNTKITISLVAVCAAMVLSTGACIGSGPDRRATSAGECTITATNSHEAQEALASAVPGSTICFIGTLLKAADLVLTRSGTAQEPITLRGNGTTVRSIKVLADQVTVDGFMAEGGGGVALKGVGLTARRNTVRNSHQEGISCRWCTDSVLEHNTVERADGSGIIVDGERVDLLSNDVGRSLKRKSIDADGIRFFGNDLRISYNTIRDIRHEGFLGEPPHTDCFQTFDNSRPPTTNTVISYNRCSNVDDQCLIATAETSHRSHGLHFIGNTCNVGASQAVLLRWYPNVEMRGNEISGPNLARGVSVLNGSVNATILGNRFLGLGYSFIEVDPSSLPGLRSDVNISR
jgi:hypothetical protein